MADYVGIAPAPKGMVVLFKNGKRYPIVCLSQMAAGAVIPWALVEGKIVSPLSSKDLARFEIVESSESSVPEVKPGT